MTDYIKAVTISTTITVRIHQKPECKESEFHATKQVISVTNHAAGKHVQNSIRMSCN
ncbi:hypothetical protein MTR_8g445350 [Medicago truncatula]|uniref:Uncharacterized protein n=1 Tax=Medicago truncatula TaxID=3880 RepID=A0A072U0C8_MEDTR|nr:hypothetical protein MTR_8g445350 [Medicago truncatula]